VPRFKMRREKKKRRAGRASNQWGEKGRFHYLCQGKKAGSVTASRGRRFSAKYIDRSIRKGGESPAPRRAGENGKYEAATRKMGKKCNRICYAPKGLGKNIRKGGKEAEEKAVNSESGN